MLILYVFIDCKVKVIYFITRSSSWVCLARQSISIDVLYSREFKSDDEINTSAEDKDVGVSIATDDHNKYFSFCCGFNPKEPFPRTNFSFSWVLTL